MNYQEFKESRKHGDGIIPVGSYERFKPYGITPVPYHWHIELEFFKLISGTLQIQHNNNFFFAEPGDLFFFNSGDLHAANHVQPETVHYQSIVFHPDLLCISDFIKIKYVDPIITGAISLSQNLRDNTLINRCFDSLFTTLQHRSLGYEIETHALLYTMFAEMTKIADYNKQKTSGMRSAEQIKKAISYIHENYNTPITLEYLSNLCNMCQGHFCRLFKRITFKTPTQYINSIRLSNAMEQLVSTNKKIIDIAMDVGFNSHSYFVYVFKSSVGITPAEFRQMHGK